MEVVSEGAASTSPGFPFEISSPPRPPSTGRTDWIGLVESDSRGAFGTEIVLGPDSEDAIETVTRSVLEVVARGVVAVVDALVGTGVPGFSARSWVRPKTTCGVLLAGPCGRSLESLA